MQDDTIASFLGKLAERTAAPAGGATAALNAALAAALLAMSARFCDGREPAVQTVPPGESATLTMPPGESATLTMPPGESAGQTIAPGVIAAEADRLRDACAALIVADCESYGPVTAAFRLRKDTDEQRAARSAAIAAALVTAAGPPAEVIAAAARLLELARALEPMANRSIAPDVAAAVEAIRAAIATSRTNIEANMSGITDPAARERLTAVIAGTDPLEAHAAAVIAAVRARYT